MIANAQRFDIQGQRLWLLPEKAIYWQKKKMLIIADLHIGKSAHFRKNGIAVPQQVNETNLDILSKLIKKTTPDHLVILGDLFHSNINKEWTQFVAWRKQYTQLEISLVVGNHDILSKQKYYSGLLNLFNRFVLKPFTFIHDIAKCQHAEPQEHYILSGHIHPAIKLKGQGRQAMKLPCFYFSKNYGVLPAFGQFTGTHVLQPKENDRIFLVANSQIISDKQLQPF